MGNGKEMEGGRKRKYSHECDRCESINAHTCHVRACAQLCSIILKCITYPLLKPMVARKSPIFGIKYLESK